MFSQEVTEFSTETQPGTQVAKTTTGSQVHRPRPFSYLEMGPPVLVSYFTIQDFVKATLRQAERTEGIPAESPSAWFEKRDPPENTYLSSYPIGSASISLYRAFGNLVGR